MDSPVNLNGKNVTLVGMGRSSLGAARLLLREGAIPFVTDHASPAALGAWLPQFVALGVGHETGGHSSAAFTQADLIVASPGVPAMLPFLVEARHRGVPVLGELELAWRFCFSKVIAVTGTNGKTTVTELLRSMITACGPTTALAGNNATSFSEAVLADPAPEFLVLEVSSYQLESTERFRPWIAAVLNLSPDHLARHGTMEAYAAEKARILSQQGPGDTAVLNADDAWCAGMPVAKEAQAHFFSLTQRVDAGLYVEGSRICAGGEAVAALADNPLPGRHNLANVLAALAIVRAGGFDWAGCLGALREFKGVEHRIEKVDTVSGVTFYNDSKSTNIDSLRVALESFGQRVVLIAGGRGKGADYGVLRDLVEARARLVILLGEDASKMAAAFQEVTAIHLAAGMREAVELAQQVAAPGESVLLSPGCASFDMYENFEERGRDFKQCVRTLASLSETLVEAMHET